MQSQIQLLVGLGNPGPRYEANRHNVGVWFVEAIAKQNSVQLLPEAKFFGRIGRLRLDKQDCWLLVPTTFMNQSGQAVQAMANFYKIPPQAILVVHDELDFSPGTIRFKQNGGHGGHNGLRDIINRLQTNDFHRLRIGIGHPGKKELVIEYVLSNPSRSDHDKIITSIERAEVVIADFVCGETQKAIRKLHDEPINK